MNAQTILEEAPSGIRRITLAPTSRGKIVGCSQSMRGALATIHRVAASMCTVLVTGASGTGKELIVAALHDASPRAKGPLVTVNCGAIPEALIESELFGHARGAFTGAHATRQGKVAIAEGGTLFLDEIGELPLAMQVKLLRILQQREYSPVGDSRTVSCDVRIVAATNRDLEAEVAAGRFREDLFYRLNVIHVHLPSLRDRREDIADLANHFLKHAAVRAGKPVRGFSPAALYALESYDWPGNIRSLENAVERAVLFSSGPTVEVGDLPDRIRGGAANDIKVPAFAPVVPIDTAVRFAALRAEFPIEEHAVSEVVQFPVQPRHATPPPPPPLAAEALPEAGFDLRSAVEAYENELIGRALAQTNWNKQHAARLLGINRTTLVEMVKRKGLSPAAR